MSEKKDYKPEIKSKNIEINSWILKDKDTKDLEWRIVDTLKKLNSKLTKKEIMELFHRIEVWNWLDSLKQELEKEAKLWWKEISDDVLKIILDLIKESKELAHKWIEELKLELNKLNESKTYDFKNEMYFFNKYPWVKKLEESEMGKNLILDLAWIWVWLADSAVAIFKFLLELIKDLIMLPRDLIKKK